MRMWFRPVLGLLHLWDCRSMWIVSGPFLRWPRAHWVFRTWEEGVLYPGNWGIRCWGYIRWSSVEKNLCTNTNLDKKGGTLCKWLDAHRPCGYWENDQPTIHVVLSLWVVAILGSNNPYTRVILSVFVLQFITVAKFRLWSSNKDDFMVGGHHNTMNCVEGSQY